MNRLTNPLLPSLALLALCASARAQTPVKPPPWWGVHDDVTVSLYWNFDSGLPTATPDFAAVPAWFDNPVQVTTMALSPNLQWIANLNGHAGVVGLAGTGGAAQAASMALTVDNDPHLDWVKVFWFQFDEFKGAGGDVAKQIEQQLNKYGRAIVSRKSDSLGAGWQRVTIEAELIPQPDDEKIDWTFLDNSVGTAAIDELYVSSRCIKPKPDERGEAMGKVVDAPLNLTALTGRSCSAAARTAGPAISPAARYWIGAAGATPSAPQELFQLSDAGVVIGTPVALPSTAAAAPLGITDLCVETLRDPTGNVLQETVYALVDLRSSGGTVNLFAFDAHNNGQRLPALDVALTAFPAVPQQRFGVTFDKDGDDGAGTFWVSTRQAATPGAYPAFEFSRSGALLQQLFLPVGGGMAYDDALGRFYMFSAEPEATPSGPIHVNGYELSAYSNEVTGTRFCGDLTLQAPGATRGGDALGIEAYRFDLGATGSELRLVCVADVGGQQFVYEVAGPFGYGYSRFGRCGMRNGPPFLGGAFDVTLEGVPDSLFAVTYMGTSSLAVPIGVEAFASILPDTNSPLIAPSPVGSFALTVNVPQNALLAYAPVFFQWVVLDTTAPGFVGFSQAGKTVLYP